MEGSHVHVAIGEGYLAALHPATHFVNNFLHIVPAGSIKKIRQIGVCVRGRGHTRRRLVW
jgi:hypothetical protein